MPVPSPTNYSELYALQHRFAQDGVSEAATADGAIAAPNAVVNLVYDGAANYTALNGSIQAGTVAGPDGTAGSADTFTDAASTNVHGIRRTAAQATVQNPSWVRFTAYLKNVNIPSVFIGLQNAGVPQIGAAFDVQAGTVLFQYLAPGAAGTADPFQQQSRIFPTISPVNPSTQPGVSGGWYKCSVLMWVYGPEYGGSGTSSTQSYQPLIAAFGGRSYLGTAIIAFAVAQPPAGVLNYSELSSASNVSALYSRNTG